MKTSSMRAGRAALAVALALTLQPVAAQTGVAPPAPIEQQPLRPPAPPPLTPAPATPLTPPPVPLPVPPSGASPLSGNAESDAVLAGRKGDPSDVDQVDLTPKPVLMIAGQTSWDQGFGVLKESFAKLRAEAERTGLAVTGRPLTLFVETDDSGYRFQAMLPVAASGGAPGLSEGIALGATPAGPAYRFVHIAPYDDIDSTYETITAYLEAKAIVVKDAFLEEYVGELTDSGDPNLEINVYVQPR